MSLCPQSLDDEAAQRFGIISGIGDDIADAVQTLDQPFGLRAVGTLARGDLEADRQAERVDDGVYLRRQATSGAADCTSLKPPF